MNQDELKKMVGQKAAEFVEDNTVVGLGTGSTVVHLVNALGERVKNEGLNIVGVPTSIRTKEQAEKLGIPIKNVDEVDHIDVTIDGADEIDPNYQGIKGGGAAHLFEKIVAINSNKNIWIVDQSKLSDHLGSFPLPVEVIPYGSEQVFRKFEAKGLNPKFRTDASGNKTLTDSKNYVIDLSIKNLDNPHELANYLKQQVGVVEHGLFLDLVNTVIVGTDEGPKVYQAR